MAMTSVVPALRDNRQLRADLGGAGSGFALTAGRRPRGASARRQVPSRPSLGDPTPSPTGSASPASSASGSLDAFEDMWSSRYEASHAIPSYLWTSSLDIPPFGSHDSSTGAAASNSVLG